MASLEAGRDRVSDDALETLNCSPNRRCRYHATPQPSSTFAPSTRLISCTEQAACICQPGGYKRTPHYHPPVTPKREFSEASGHPPLRPRRNYHAAQGLRPKDMQTTPSALCLCFLSSILPTKGPFSASQVQLCHLQSCSVWWLNLGHWPHQPLSQFPFCSSSLLKDTA